MKITVPEAMAAICHQTLHHPEVAMIVNERPFVAVRPRLSVNWKVMVVGPPAVVGVPEIVAPLSDRPAGRVPESIDQL